MSSAAPTLLYADEDVAGVLIDFLIDLGYDVLTAFDDGRANQGIDDFLVLARAIALNRTVLTKNRRDYHRLHTINPIHCGIITYTDDINRSALAQRIDTAIRQCPQPLNGQLIRVIKPSR